MNSNKEKDLLDLLDIIILMMMLIEKLEDFQIENHYHKQHIKSQVKILLKTITPLAERDYALVFKAGEEDTLQVIREYERLVALIRDFNIPQKCMLTQMIEAFNCDKDAMEGTTHRILKKIRK